MMVDDDNGVLMTMVCWMPGHALRTDGEALIRIALHTLSMGILLLKVMLPILMLFRVGYCLLQLVCKV